MNNHAVLSNDTAELPRRASAGSEGAWGQLTAREAALLQYLVARAGRTVSRDELLLHVWGLNPQCTITRTVDMHIAHLRDKLRDDAEQPRRLLTVRGQGYMFANR